MAAQRHCHVEVGLGIARPVLQRGSVMRDGLVGLAEPVERYAEVVVRLGEGRSERDRPAIGGDRSIDLAAPPQRNAKIGVHRCVPVINGDGVGDKRHCGCIVPALVLEDA
ncbi:MAG TPA: hypothetical protein VF502_10810 [Stellaceae bacterium]